MMDLDKLLIAAGRHGAALPIVAIATDAWKDRRKSLSAAARRWAEAHAFAAEPGSHLAVPGPDGKIAEILAGAGGASGDPFALGKFARALPPGLYSLGGDVSNLRLAALAWCLEAYSFASYRKSSAEPARLVCPNGVDRAEILRAARAVYIVRDLVNTPASDLGPAELEAAARQLAAAHQGQASGDQGSSTPPRLPDDPRGRQGEPAGPASHRFHLGAGARAQGDAGRQGRVLRYRRPRHQARLRHGSDEEGHGRRGHGPRPGPDDHGRPGFRCACGF